MQLVKDSSLRQKEQKNAGVQSDKTISKVEDEDEVMLTTLSFQEYMDDDLDVLVQNKGIETEQDPDLDLDQELLFDQDDQY